MKLPKHNAKDLFAEALRLTDPAERAAYLDRTCAGDPALRQEVESLLSAHAQAGDFLRPTISLLEPDLAHEHAGTRIGRYKLLEQIGEGGFGVVWMAEQEEPVRRRVALKIIKLGMDTKEVLARFDAERQALAMMDHPNIARVFDGGATDTGRPYFVMELVKGIPITSYCDANKLATRERLALFMEVCHAVQHAHQKGVIHRDLKPSNILVTVQDDRPVPKVIDFGVAKATQARLTEKTVFTRFHQFIGTPAYMSPEQAGLGSYDVDTRSDVYSLGVLLYELLTGRTPFDTQKLLENGYEAVMQTIRDEEPPKPSTRLSTLAEQELSAVAVKRGAEPAKLGRLAEAEAAFREGLTMSRTLNGEDSRYTDDGLSRLVGILRQQRKQAELETLLRETVERRRKLLGDKHPRLASSLADLADALLTGEKLTEAEPAARECLAISENGAPDGWEAFHARSLLGACLLGQKHYAEAEPLLEAGYQGMRQHDEEVSRQNKPRDVKLVLTRLIQLCDETSQSAKAAAWRKALAEFEKRLAEVLPGSPSSPR